MSVRRKSFSSISLFVAYLLGVFSGWTLLDYGLSQHPDTDILTALIDLTTDLGGLGLTVTTIVTLIGAFGTLYGIFHPKKRSTDA